MKVYVLTEIDLQHVGYSPNTVKIFPTHGAAVAEMERMYKAALELFGSDEDDNMNVFDAGGYACVGNDYRLDVYECEFAPVAPSLESVQGITVVAEETGIRAELMQSMNMSRDEVWALMRKWAVEFDESHKDFDYAEHDTSFYDEIDDFVAEKFHAFKHPYTLRPDADIEYCFEIYDENFFGKQEVSARMHVCDGYAEGEGIRMEYPKLADLTAAQIEEMDQYLGGRIKDSGTVVPDDVMLVYGKVVSFQGIMDTGQNHDEDLVRRINIAWLEDKSRFRPILVALYERDIDEITDHDAFRIPAWEEWPEYHHGCNTNDWTAYNDCAFAEMQTNWDDYAGTYLKHIADGRDLQCILGFIGK